ncbi:helix-turn-helix transcriptional regulator [Nocardiopsis quinghaiensis]|uniref:helix-turn-helix transcriptional regulator n=1 Tax=Nocardiopsis quinghaiensis TaxID=464995 RepID=UPI001CC255FB|nr:LuxR C-terminal-related transcriptional regulator [Nocardiopsis quinghaiensis]
MNAVCGPLTAPTGSGRPLRGLDRELARVASVLDRVPGRCGVLVLVEGSVGSGRTRFLQECIDLARAYGYRVNTGGLLSRFAAGPDGASADPAERFLTVVDDADRLSDLEVRNLALLWDQNGHGSVWLVARKPGARTRRFDAHLSTPSRQTVRIALGPLAPGEVHELTRDILGADPAPALVDLVGQASGNPQLVVELLHGLLEERSVLVDGSWGRLAADRLPQRLYHWAEAVLDECSAECRQFLKVRAVLGDRVALDRFLAFLGMRPTELLPLIEEARWAGLLKPGPDLDFSSPLARRVISSMVPEDFRLIMRRESHTPGPRTRPLPEAVPEPRTGPGADGPPVRDQRRVRPLTEQERSIVDLVAEGLTNRQVARRLTISPNTVNYHLKKLFRAYGVGSRMELLHIIRRHDLVGFG